VRAVATRNVPSEMAQLVAISNLERFRASSNRQLLTIADIERFNTRTQIDRELALRLGERGIKHQEIVKRAVHLETTLRTQKIQQTVVIHGYQRYTEQSALGYVLAQQAN
jgi:hypothetical protein